jgi:hypothetical protein
MINIVRYSVWIATLVLTPFALFSQISISSDDILSLKGTSHGALAPLEDSTVVTITPGGANQTWDLSSVNTGSYIAGAMEYKEPEDGYRPELYPDANFLQRITAETEEGIFIIDSYMNVSSSQLRTLGTASNFGGFEFLEFDQDDVAPLPMTYGTSWLAVSHDTTSQIGFETITLDSSWNTVDAYGTLRLPSGDYQSLRIREYNKAIESTTFNGAPFSGPDTTTGVFYTWLTKEHLLTCSVDSLEDGMGSLGVIVSEEVSSVAEASDNLPQQFSLEQNYPNPFNPETLIRFSLPAASRTELTVVNLLGQTVRTLVSGALDAGEHSFTWDGRDASGTEVPSGVYLYSLRSAEGVQTRKMTLLR